MMKQLNFELTDRLATEINVLVNNGWFLSEKEFIHLALVELLLKCKLLTNQSLLPITKIARPLVQQKEGEILTQLLTECQVETGIGNLAHQHDHYLHGTPLKSEYGV